MEHDRRCEHKRVMDLMVDRYASLAWKERFWEDALHHLRRSGPFCACMARSWGVSVNLEVGMRIAEHKAERFMDAWRRAKDKSLEQGARELAETINDRVHGRNVIDIQDRREGE